MEKGGEKLDAYGENVCKLVMEINNNLGKFSRKPVGPIGLEVSFKKGLSQEDKYVVEGELGSLLTSFIVDNFKDREILSQLQRKCNVFQSQIIITKFSEFAYDVSRGKFMYTVTRLKRISRERLKIHYKRDSLYPESFRNEINIFLSCCWTKMKNVIYSRLRLIEPPWDRPYLALISGVSYYPARLFSKTSKFTTKGGSNKWRELLTEFNVLRLIRVDITRLLCNLLKLSREISC